MIPNKTTEYGCINFDVTLQELFTELDSSGNNVLIMHENVGDPDSACLVCVTRGPFASAAVQTLRTVSESFAAEQASRRPDRLTIPALTRHRLAEAAADIHHSGGYGFGFIRLERREILWVGADEDLADGYTTPAEIEDSLQKASNGLADSVTVSAGTLPAGRDGWIQFHP